MAIFDEVKVKKVEADFSKVVLDPRQRDNMKQLSKLLAEILPMSELALRGFIWKAYKEHQLERGAFAVDDASADKDTRLRITIELSKKVQKNLSLVLKNSADQSIIDDAFKKALEYYKKHLL